VSTFLLLYEFVFFNIVVPGHTRGAITLDGKHTSDSFLACCCCRCNTASDLTAGKHSHKQVPSQRDRANCAICNLAARVVPPDVISFIPQVFEFLRMVTLPIPSVPASISRISIYLGRAPPGL
jgi:hypothetical protein